MEYQLPTEMTFVQCETYNNCIYIIGANGNNHIYRFDTDKCQWTQLLKDFPIQRKVNQHSTCAVKIDDKNLVLSIGGMRSKHTLLFDLKEEKWLNKDINEQWTAENSSNIVNHSWCLQSIVNPQNRDEVIITGGFNTGHNAYILNVRKLYNISMGRLSPNGCVFFVLVFFKKMTAKLLYQQKHCQQRLFTPDTNECCHRRHIITE